MFAVFTRSTINNVTVPLQQLERPAMDGRMIDRDPTFGHHFFKMTQTQRIRDVPAHAPHNHLQRIVQAFQYLSQRRVQRLHQFSHRRLCIAGILPSYCGTSWRIRWQNQIDTYARFHPAMRRAFQSKKCRSFTISREGHSGKRRAFRASRSMTSRSEAQRRPCIDLVCCTRSTIKPAQSTGDIPASAARPPPCVRLCLLADMVSRRRTLPAQELQVADPAEC